MKSIETSAPGKLLLVGEYAVLEGAPAVVLAVNRRARARVTERDGTECSVGAPDLGIMSARLRIGAQGAPEWPSADEQASLKLVDCALRVLASTPLGPEPGRGFELHLDTSDFFDEAMHTKLGLGSSAALCVAVTSALAGLRSNEPKIDLRLPLQVHREFQSGQGSGADVAASFAGGVLIYRLQGAEPHVDAVRWPSGVHARYVWSGRSASTSDFLARLGRWRDGHAVQYAFHMRGLSDIAASAAEAVMQNGAADFIEAASAYARALQSFGVESGLEIYSPEHLALAELAHTAGVHYKSCGAGGGDFGVLLALDADKLAAAERAVARAGFRCMPLAMDEQGLHVEHKVSETECI